jgi:hypothetical protein
MKGMTLAYLLTAEVIDLVIQHSLYSNYACCIGRLRSNRGLKLRTESMVPTIQDIPRLP